MAGSQRASIASCREVADRIEAHKPTELDAHLHALCSEISTLVPAESVGDRLWNDIADPDDDDRRLVYADWLCEQGDTAQGEFISLQILEANNHEASEKQQALLTSHRDRWLGPFAHIGAHVRLERGLPISAGFGGRSWFHHHLIGHRLWSTVRTVSGAGSWRTSDEVYIDALDHPRMNNLRSLETTPQIAAALATKRARPWTSLKLFVSTAGGSALPLPGTIQRLPKLTHLGISDLLAVGIQGAEKQCASALAKRELRLTACRTDDGFDSVEPVEAFYAVAQASRFSEVRITEEDWDEGAVTFSRDDAGELSRARGTAEALVAAELENLPARSLTQILVEGQSEDSDLNTLLTTVGNVHGCQLIEV